MSRENCINKHEHCPGDVFCSLHQSASSVLISLATAISLKGKVLFAHEQPLLGVFTVKSEIPEHATISTQQLQFLDQSGLFLEKRSQLQGVKFIPINRPLVQKSQAQACFIIPAMQKEDPNTAKSCTDMKSVADKNGRYLRFVFLLTFSKKSGF